MANEKYLSKINVPVVDAQGTIVSTKQFLIKDAGARQAIEDLIASLSGALKWIGFTSTALTDGASTNPIIVSGQSVTAVQGNVVGYYVPINPNFSNVSVEAGTSGRVKLYENNSGHAQIIPVIGDIILVAASTNDSYRVGNYYKVTDIAQDQVIMEQVYTKSSEFVYNGSIWQEFGNTGSLGALAFVNSVKANYTPAGSVNVSKTKKKLSTTTIKGVAGTTSVVSGVNVSTTDVKSLTIPIAISTELNSQLSKQKMVTSKASKVSVIAKKLGITTIKGVAGSVTLHDTPTLNKTEVVVPSRKPTTGEGLFYMSIDEDNEILTLTKVDTTLQVGTGLTAGGAATVATPASGNTTVATGSLVETAQTGGAEIPGSLTVSEVTVATGSLSSSGTGASVVTGSNASFLQQDADRTENVYALDGSPTSTIVTSVTPSTTTVATAASSNTTVATGALATATASDTNVVLTEATASFSGTAATIISSAEE